MRQKNKKILLIGIAGSSKDFLLAPYLLKSFSYQDDAVRNSTDIIINQYSVEDDWNNIIKDIHILAPDLLGFSCYTWNFDMIKNILNSVKYDVVLGGPEINRKDILNGKFNSLNANFLVFGEGEKTFYNLLNGDKKSNGLAYKENGLFICNEEPEILDLEKLPSPYLTQIADDILSKKNIRANIESQRGCNFRCAYCLYHKNFPKIRYKNPETVVNEIKYIYDKGITEARILDANFLSDKEFAKNVMEGLISHKIIMSLLIEVHPAFVDAATSNLFSEYLKVSPKNKLVIGIGLQTINQESLRIIKRQIPLSIFNNALDLLGKTEAIIRPDIILGLPRETKKTYYETLEYICERMRHDQTYMNLCLMRVLPNTEFVEIAQKEKYVLKEGEDHLVRSTPTMSSKDMVDCQRIHVVMYRLLSTENFKNRLQLRRLYFNVKDKRGITNMKLLEYFANEFLKMLPNTDFASDEFPNVEIYYKKIFNEISDEWLIKKLNSLYTAEEKIDGGDVYDKNDCLGL